MPDEDPSAPTVETAAPASVTDVEVSVVLICYNDETRLPEAIESARQQTLASIEIVIVDHGSTDGSPQVAARAAAEDPRIRVVALPDNEGKPGRTINAGIDAARAEWVTVFASDDLLQPNACEILLGSARRHNAELVIGSLRRLNAETGASTRWAQTVTRRSRLVTTGRQYAELVRDTTGGGKLFNKHFMAEHGLRFAEDIYYQDQVLTLEYLACASRVAIDARYVLDWRYWPSSDKQSVTQRRSTEENLRDRFTANERIVAYLRAAGRDDLLGACQAKFIEHDLRGHVRDLTEATAEYRHILQERSTQYAEAFPPGLLERVALPSRLMFQCLLAGRLLDASALGGTTFAELTSRWGRLDEHGRTYLVPPWSEATTADSIFDVTDVRINEWPRLFTPVVGRVSVSSRLGVVAFRVELDSHGRLRDEDLAELFLLQPETGERFGFPLKRAKRSTTFSSHFGGFRLDGIIGHAPHPSQLWVAVNRDMPGEWWLRLQPTTDLPDCETVETASRPWYTVTRGSEITLHREPGPTMRERMGAARRRTRTEVAQREPAEELTQGRVRRILDAADVEPDERLVLFESFAGRKAAGGPLQVSAALRRLRPDIKQIWAYSGSTLRSVPDYAIAVPRTTRPYAKALSQASLWFDNGWLNYAPNAQQRLVQLWHGTPLVATGDDLVAAAESDEGVPIDPRAARRREWSAHWSGLASSGPVFEERMRRGFPITAEVLPTGSPRSDELLGAGLDERRSQLRRAWGLDDRFVVLFCPALREGEVADGYREPDLRELSELLGPDCYWLHREHDDEIATNRVPAAPHDLRWFAGVVPGHLPMTDLLLVSDLLVSDYSTVMIDQGLLRKPVIHFVTDAEFFEHTYPTSYLHLDQSSAGPVVGDERELADQIQQLRDDAEWARKAGELSHEWARELVPLDTGTSAEELLRALGLLE